jgi:hypothetical protein
VPIEKIKFFARLYLRGHELESCLFCLQSSIVLSKVVLFDVARGAEGDEILLGVGPRVAAKLFVMNFQV